MKYLNLKIHAIKKLKFPQPSKRRKICASYRNPQFYKDIISKSSADSGIEALSTITDLCNFLLSGKVNPKVCKYFYGASLCALIKKDNGIRPIAIGIALRRLVSKHACSKAKIELKDYFLPTQVGAEQRKVYHYIITYGNAMIIHHFYFMVIIQ